MQNLSEGETPPNLKLVEHSISRELFFNVDYTLGIESIIEEIENAIADRLTDYPATVGILLKSLHETIIDAEKAWRKIEAMDEYKNFGSREAVCNAYRRADQQRT